MTNVPYNDMHANLVKNVVNPVDAQDAATKDYVDSSSFTWQGAWATSTDYVLNDCVQQNGSGYVCTEAHTSGTFATDLAAGKWSLFVQGSYNYLTAYAQIASTFTGAANTNAQDVTGLEATIVLPEEKRIKVTAFAPSMYTTSAAGSQVEMRIYEGATQKAVTDVSTPDSNYMLAACCIFSVNATAGSHTYKVAMRNAGAGAPRLLAGATYPAFIMIEVIG